MIKRILTAAVVVALVTLPACSGGYRATYDIALIGAERSSAAAERYGRHEINIVDERGTEVCYFEDALVAVAWIPSVDALSFDLTNKSDRTIEIIWDEAKFEDENGVVHQAVHAGVKSANPKKSQKPTVVEGGGRVSDSVRSMDNIHYEGGIHGDWQMVPFFPTAGKTNEDLTAEARQYIDKTVKVVLPLRTEVEMYDYTFVFKVEGVHVQKVGKKD